MIRRQYCLRKKDDYKEPAVVILGAETFDKAAAAALSSLGYEIIDIEDEHFEEVKEIEVKYTMNKDGELSNFSNITVDGNLFRPVEKHQDYHGGKNVYVTEKWRRGGGK
jgi:hypothetical protein